MSQRKKRHSLPNYMIPVELYPLFGPMPLLPGEDHDAYSRLLSTIAAAVEPTDAIDWMYLKDVVDLAWEITRLHRWKVEIIKTGCPTARQELFETLLANDTSALELSDKARTMSAKYASADEKVVSEMRGKMTQQGFTEESVLAVAFAKRIDILDVIENMLASAQRRRTGLLNEIERRRKAFGHKLSRVIDQTVTRKTVDDAPPLDNAEAD